MTDSLAPATSDIELRLVDPAKNKHRLYGLTECTTLWGELCLRVAWGRIGHRRIRERSEVFADRRDLDARRAELLARRRRHGYRVVAASTPRVLTERQDTALGGALAMASPASRERPAVVVSTPATTTLAVECDVVEAHGLELRDSAARALVGRWLAATRELSEFLAERQAEHLDLIDVSTLAAMYAHAAGIA